MPYTRATSPLRAIPRALFLFTFLAIASSGSSKVVYVNRNAAGPVHDGASWGTACLTVKAGIATAVQYDEVWVAKGAYIEDISLPEAHVAMYGGFSGVETARSQRDWKTNATVIDGAGTTSGQMVTVQFADETLDGFTLRNGGYPLYATGGGVTFSNNAVIHNRMQIYIAKGASATITGNTISENGFHGVYINGTATLANNTISGNVTTGIVVWGSATITGNTISGNGYGVAIGSTGTGTLANNIVAFNAGTGVSVDQGSITSFGDNDVFANLGGDIVGFTPADGLGNLSIDPLLSNPYHDPHIQPGSPCIDAGDNSAAFGTTDIDGQPRIRGARVDIGSDESDGTTWTFQTAVLHVSPAGDNVNDGLTWTTAKRTISSALAVAKWTDEVWIAEGTYAEQLTVPPGLALYGGFAGTETARNQRNWTTHLTVLDGGALQGYVVSCPYAASTVDGFTISLGNGVQITGVATVANSTITNGVAASGSATLIGNTIYGTSAGVYIDGMATLINNRIIAGSGYGVEVEWGQVTLRANVITGAGYSGVLLNAAKASLRDNVIAGCSTGVQVEGNYIGFIKPSIVDLTSNTITGNTYGVYVGDECIVSMANNIVAFSSKSGVSQRDVVGITTFSHNDVFGSAGGDYYRFAPPTGQSNISSDPLFVNRTSGVFRLQAGSPCIDAGDDGGVAPGEKDLDGKPRILGAHVDIGAYEYGAPPAYTLNDVITALKLAAGGLVANNDSMNRLNPEAPATLVDLADAVRVARMVEGLEPNP